MGESVPGGGTHKCQGPELGARLVCCRHSRAAMVMGGWRGALREIVGCQVSSAEMGLAHLVVFSARPLRAVLG